MKYKVGDKVRVRKDISVKGNWGFVEEMKSFIGKAVTISRLVSPYDDEYMILEDGGEYVWTEELFEGLANEAPSITKRINKKHDIINGLTNTDDSVDGGKVASNSEEAKTKDSHYERASMQPLEVMQRLMTEEQFKGFLLGNCIKYRMRSQYKGQHDSDEYKARQYAYWLELANMGKVINPSRG